MSFLPDFIANCCEDVNPSFLPACISSTGMLPTPADLPFFKDLTAVSIFSRIIVFCPSIYNLSFFCEAFS